MSSLQKFHRRTLVVGGGVVSPFTTIGSGNNTVGYWLGDLATNRLVVAPKSTETQPSWGSFSVYRGVINTTDGLANTNTLYSLGSASHPAAYYARALTTGGYNTWYLPAKDELNTLYSNKSATPFATANAFAGNAYWSSTEYNNNLAWTQYFPNGFQGNYVSKSTAAYSRATRRSTI